MFYSFARMSKLPHEGPVVLFDGYCHLCSNTVQWIMRRDRRKVFRFAPLQSEVAAALAGRERTQPTDTILLYESGKVFSRSTAALRLLRYLPGLWPAAYWAIIIPRPVRDAVYSWIAANRYRWFGRRQQCFLPDAADRDRFL